ncbi:MAG: tetratricopeptide repeat protein [Pseudobdellovibrionaceae bacterium]
MKVWIVSILFLSVGFSAQAQNQAQAQDSFSWSAWWSNLKGNQLLRDKQASEALKSYVQGLSAAPFHPDLHLNLGLTFEVLGQNDKALSEYKQSEKFWLPKKDAKIFYSYFNQAQVLGKEKKVEEALELYQKALAINPTSMEVKTNIELLTQQQQGQGQGEGKDQDPKNQDQNKQNKPEDKNNDSDKDKSEKDKDQNKDQNKDKDNKTPKNSPKYKPRPFDGKEISEQDAKKILGELKQQEQKIRAEYNKRQNSKESPRDKDW